MMTTGKRNFMRTSLRETPALAAGGRNLRDVALPLADGCSDLGERHALLTLVLASAVAVGSLTDVIRVGFKKDHLRHALISVDLGRQGCGIRELQRHEALPFGFERRDIHDDAATRIR